MAEAYIRADKNTGVVTFIHKRPFDPTHGLHKTRDELSKTGYFVNNFPEPNTVVGKRAIAYYDHERKAVYYEYETTPFSEKDRLDLLEETLNQVIMHMLGDSYKGASNSTAIISTLSIANAAGKEPVDMGGLARYLAYQIYQGNLEKDFVLKRYPDCKEEIEKYLEKWDTIPVFEED